MSEFEVGADHRAKLGRDGLVCDGQLRYSNKWQRDYFPSLLIRQKWHIASRNVRVGDIVLVQDSNLVRGAWKLAQVMKAEPGRDGKVRDVDLRYKMIKQGKGYDGDVDRIMSRSVHRLVVLLPIEEQM